MTNFVAIDFETAGRGHATACAVALVEVTEGVITSRWNTLIDPECGFDGINISVHGIQPEDVIGSPTWPEVMEQIARRIDGRLVIAHNASFDTNVIVRSCFRYGLPIPESNTACTVTLARAAWPGLPAYRLNVVAEHLGIDLIHHDAESDAHACAQIALAGHSKGTGPDAIRQTSLTTIAERAIQRDQQRRRSIF